MKQAITILIVVFSSPTWACSFARTTEPFEVDAPGSIEPRRTEFEVAEIVRGSDDGNPHSCSDAGVITLKALDPPSETGFIFEVVKGEFEDRLFTQEPITPADFKEPGEFTFIWLDGSSYEQEPFDIVVQVTPISRTGNVGQPTTLNVSHPGIKKPWWRFW